MKHEEYIDLFHKAQVNLVAFKPVFHCNEELRHMVEMAVEAEREEIVKDFMARHEEAKHSHNFWHVAANQVKARGNK